MSSQSLALCPRFLHVAQICLKLQLEKVDHPLFQDTHMRSSVSGLTGLRIGPPDGGKIPGRAFDCGHGGGGGCVMVEGDCSACITQASAVWLGS